MSSGLGIKYNPSGNKIVKGPLSPAIGGLEGAIGHDKDGKITPPKG